MYMDVSVVSKMVRLISGYGHNGFTFTLIHYQCLIRGVVTSPGVIGSVVTHTSMLMTITSRIYGDLCSDC